MNATPRQIIRGYIIDAEVKGRSGSSKAAPKEGDDVEVDEDDDDDDDDDDFMEMEDIKAVVGGAFQSRSQPATERTVFFHDEVSKKNMYVTGPFLFTDCWWQIEATIHPGTRKVKDIPKYKIKEKWNLEMISKYLKKTGIERPADLKTIMDVVKMMYQKGTVNRNLSLTVEQILELKNLKQRASERQIPILEKERAALSLMENHASSSVSAYTNLILRARDYPNLFWMLPSILPKKAFSILTYNLQLHPRKKVKERFGRGDPEFDLLNEAVVASPWEFAFSWVLYHKYNLSGCEARYFNLKNSGIFDQLDENMQDNIIVYDNLKTYCRRKGHTFIHCPGKAKRDSLVFRNCKDRGKTQMFLCSDRIRAMKCEPPVNSTTSIPLPSLYLRKYWEAEKSIAKYLKQILQANPLESKQMHLPKLESSDWDTLDENQKAAVECIRKKPLTILSGMGGCGKTTVVAKIVGSYLNFVEPPSEAAEHILLTAPTGKAASLLGKKCGLPSYTIHSVIFSHMVWKQSYYETSTDEENRWKYADVKMLVVDECSMVAVTTVSRLLEILLKDSALCKLVLVGDIRQLPSVEPGNFFEDVFQVAEERGLGVDLKTNHRVDAGGIRIVDNAKRISQKKMPKSDEETDGLPEELDCRFHLLKISSREKDDKKWKSDVMDKTLSRLEDLLSSKWEGITDDKTSQIITFTRKLVAESNMICCKYYNDHYPFMHGKKEFRPGDKICCRKNCRISDLSEEDDNRGKDGDNCEGASEPKGGKKMDTKESVAVFTEKGNLHGNCSYLTQVTEVIADPPGLENGDDSWTEIRDHQSSKGCEDNMAHLPEGLTGVVRGRNGQGEPITDANASSDRGSSARENPVDKMVDRADESPANVIKFSNGETFKIVSMHTVMEGKMKSEIAVLDDLEGDEIKIDFKSFRKVGKADHAWCRTIHTFQGSEVKTIVYLISSCKTESWKHVYTAVTRGQEEVVMIGSKEDLRNAIQTEFRRDTGLRGFLRRALQDEGNEPLAVGESTTDGDESTADVDGDDGLLNMDEDEKNLEMYETSSASDDSETILDSSPQKDLMDELGEENCFSDASGCRESCQLPPSAGQQPGEGTQLCSPIFIKHRPMTTKSDPQSETRFKLGKSVNSPHVTPQRIVKLSTCSSTERKYSPSFVRYHPTPSSPDSEAFESKLLLSTPKGPRRKLQDSFNAREGLTSVVPSDLASGSERLTFQSLQSSLPPLVRQPQIDDEPTVDKSCNSFYPHSQRAYQYDLCNLEEQMSSTPKRTTPRKRLLSDVTDENVKRSPKK